MSGSVPGPLINVGAIRFFFGRPSGSSFSLSLSSLFCPATLAPVLRGVSGGVVIGTPVTLPEFVAVSPGTLPAISGWGPAGTAEVCVITDDVELDRAGDDGRWLTKLAAGGGDGAVNELIESRWRCCEPLRYGDGGANCAVGVGIGVVCAEDATASATSERRFCGSALTASPRSVGENETDEQKPSEEVINSVVPSEDLRRH